MNILKSAWLVARRSGLLGATGLANQFINKWHTMLRIGYVGAIGLTIAGAIVGDPDIAQGAPGGTPGKPGGSGSTKAVSFTGVNLGVLPGDSWSMAFAVSESGSVVGVSASTSSSEETSFSPAYWYFNGQTWDVYALPKGASVSANGTAYGIAGPVDTLEYVVGHVGSKAVIWTVTGHTSFSAPEPLDQDEQCNWSDANSVNVHRVAVGTCESSAAVWMPGPTGHSTNVLQFPANRYTEAMDVNDDGVIVGRDCDLLAELCHAFVMQIGSNTAIQLDDQVNGDPYSYAAAVSDVVTINDTRVVYVTGSTTSAEGVETGTRWTVTFSEEGTLLNAVAQVTLTKQWCSGVNDIGDAVCTSSGGGRQSTAIIRGGVVSNLKPAKKATDAATFDLARTDGLPTYAVGVSQVNGLRATVWVIDK